MAEGLERQARNEALLREVNERLERVDKQAESRGWPPEHGLFEFHCECGTGCPEKVQMTIEEYETVRAQDDRFALVPGHENPELEGIVERTERYVVVDKYGEAEAVVSDDPRGAPKD
ncbi:MAG TPA: hypothetical protein VES61_05730 [Gaiellaceae bacterium]|nr:hypothetical protein [Gaiellaceae bacterium]